VPDGHHKKVTSATCQTEKSLFSCMARNCPDSSSGPPNDRFANGGFRPADYVGVAGASCPVASSVFAGMWGLGLCKSPQTRLGHSALFESTTGAHKNEEREIL
jgi:hypothetical protein